MGILGLEIILSLAVDVWTCNKEHSQRVRKSVVLVVPYVGLSKKGKYGLASAVLVLGTDLHHLQRTNERKVHN